MNIYATLRANDARAQRRNQNAYTLDQLTFGIRAGFDKGENATDKAIHAQGDIRGKTVVITELLKVLCEKQKTIVLAEIKAAAQRRRQRKASRRAASIQDLINLVVVHVSTLKDGSVTA